MESSAEAEELCYAAAADDAEGVAKALGGGGVTPNTTDYCGRTPLHISALGGCASATKVPRPPSLPTARGVTDAFDAPMAAILGCFKGLGSL